MPDVSHLLFQINVEYRSGMRTYTMTPSRKHVRKAVARHSRSAMLVELLKDPISKRYMLRHIGILLRKELSQMCSDETNSIHKSQSMSDLRNFSWDTQLKELSIKAPTLLSILQSCTYMFTPRQNRNATIGLCCSLLLKYRYSKICIVQKVISVILAAGSSRKLVCNQLLLKCAILSMVYDILHLGI